MAEITMDVIKKIAVISREDSGYRKELNLVSWNGGEPKLDLRRWSHEDKALKGITLTEEETKELYKVLGEILSE